MGILLDKIKKCLKPVFLLLLMIPLGASFLLGSFFEKQQETMAIPVAIVDEDQSEFSEAILAGMKTQEMLTVLEGSMEEGSRWLERNEVDSLFILKAGFQERLLQEKGEESIALLTSPTSVASGIVQEVVASEVIKITSGIKAANRVQRLYDRHGVEAPHAWQNAYDFTLGQWEPVPLMTIDYVEGSLENDRMLEKGMPTSTTIPYLGIWGFFTMMVCFITSDWVVKERSILFSRMKTTYKGLSSYLCQTVGAFLLFQIGQTLISFWILTHFEKMEREAIGLVGMLVFILFSLSASVWLASYISHLGSYYIAGIVVAFLLALGGGSFIGMAELSPTLEEVSRVLPYRLLGNGDDREKWKVLFLTLGVSGVFWRWSIWRLNVR
jgi:ABC-2 type transport system permease protein